METSYTSQQESATNKSNEKGDNMGTGETNTALSTQNKNGFDLTFKIFGIKEEEFVRPAYKGNYTPTVDQLKDLFLDNKISHNEARILFYIEKHTVRFRKTHFKINRKKIQEDLGIVQPKVSSTIKSLKEKNYILEAPVENEKGCYYYCLNPKQFEGVIVLRSIKEIYKVNKDSKNFITKKEYTKRVWALYQKGMGLIPKWYKETLQPHEIKNDFDLLQYIVLQYIYLHSISDAKESQIIKIQQIIDEEKKPLNALKKFAELVFEEDASNLRDLINELFRSHESRVDAVWKKDIKYSVIGSLSVCWPSLRKSFMVYKRNQPIQIDIEKQTAINQIKELYQSYLDIIQPKAEVIELKKAVNETPKIENSKQKEEKQDHSLPPEGFVENICSILKNKEE